MPFNPSLINQVSFYANRMKKEAVIRRTASILMAGTMFIQFFAVISPPQPSLAASGNDIIPGGITSKQNAVDWCNTNLEIRTIFSHFGVTCSAIAKSVVDTSVNTHEYSNQMYSLGRYPYGKAGETPVKIGAQTFYMRFVSSWGNYNFKALKGTRINGTPFLIMFDCGNIIIIGPPSTPPPPPPAPEKCPLDRTILKSDARCKPCPYNNSIIASSASCKPPKCPYDSSITSDNPLCKACPYDSTILKSNPECPRCPYQGSTGLSSKDSACKEPCPYNSTIAKDSTGCKPCEKSENPNDSSACVELSKTAANITQDIAAADGTTAKGGDTIVYTLTAKNTGKATVPNFEMQESIGDLLDYADVEDFHGGSWNKQTNIVTWPIKDIAPEKSIQNKLTIKIKSPIPNTPVSSSNPGTGDLTLTNVYGNAVNIKLPPSIVKTTEQITTTTLPNTGPGESLAFGFVITAVVGYFFARSRLFATELDIVRKEYAYAGGI